MALTVAQPQLDFSDLSLLIEIVSCQDLIKAARLDQSLSSYLALDGDDQAGDVVSVPLVGERLVVVDPVGTCGSRPQCLHSVDALATAPCGDW